MTSASDRIKERHRGWRQAQPARESRLAALSSFGLKYDHIDDFNVLVESRYQLNLALSFWRSVDDPQRQGYLVSALAAELKKLNPEKPVTGRDSAAGCGDRTVCTTEPPQAARAESVTGPTSLPGVQWP